MLLKYYNNIKKAKNKQLVFVQSWHNHMSDVFPDDYIMIRLAVAPTGRFCEALLVSVYMILLGFVSDTICQTIEKKT